MRYTVFPLRGNQPLSSGPSPLPDEQPLPSAVLAILERHEWRWAHAQPELLQYLNQCDAAQRRQTEEAIFSVMGLQRLTLDDLLA